jgi:predicted glycosyltransferase
LACRTGTEREAASYAAKEMKIPVIELQHGVISNGHLAYITYVNIEPNPYPDYLFCFGEEFKKFVSPFICEVKNIFVTGNYYIDYIKRNKNKNKELFNKKYSHINSQVIITVASQSMFVDAELEFLEKILEFRKNIYFIYVLREITPKLTCYLHKNISIETELDIYQCMQNSHITSTVYSTCAVESLVFGTPVILMNIQNWARFTYSEFFSPSDAVFYANTPEEYISYITFAINKDRKQIASDATRYYAENPKKCTEQAFEKLSTDMMVLH